MNLGAVLDVRLAQTCMQQRQLMAHVGTEHHHHVGLFDLGQRRGEGVGHCSIGEVAIGQTMVQIATAQPFGQTRE